MYDSLAAIYDWLVPDELLSPQGNAEAFAMVTTRLERGASVLDCAAGSGLLAVGLALAGFEATASDASPGMLERTATLAAAHGVHVPAITCPWESLQDQGWQDRFDAVFCVGNSLVHAAGRDARRAALAGMHSVAKPGGIVVVTSRNWELVRRDGSRFEATDHLVERHGRKGLPLYHWTIAASWDEPHALDVGVALLSSSGEVELHGETLPFFPFTHESLLEDLASAGLVVELDKYLPDEERYLVVARA